MIWAGFAASTRQNPPIYLAPPSDEEQISLRRSVAAPTTEECLEVALLHQYPVDLEGDSTRSGHEVVRAIPKRACVHQNVAIIPIHVTELANTFMTSTAVELHDEAVLVVVDVCSIRET